MADQIPNFWPPIFTPRVPLPVALLRQQAGQLLEKSGGVLEAQVISEGAGQGVIRHRFRIVAKALDYWCELFSASHGQDFVYPVTVSFREWDDAVAAERQLQAETGMIGPLALHGLFSGDRSAATPDEFTEMLQQILQSKQTRALLLSLIAKINVIEDKAQQTSPKPTQP